MSIGVLGPLTHDGTATFGRRDRAVLAALAMFVGRTVSADRLVHAVWGGDPPASSHKALQGCVVRLRKALGADAIETSAQGYRLLVPPDTVDAQRFERIVVRGRELLALGEPERAAYLLAQSLELWRGRAFEDVESWDLATAEVGRLDELRLEAEELRVEASLRAGRHLEVLAAAESMVTAAPLRERRWALLAWAQYQSGRQTEALRTIQRVKSLLADRLGLDPGPDLSGLETAILRQDASLLPDRAVPASGTCPYQGLLPYDVEDAESFFGRADDVRSCLDLLRTSGVLAVVGPSGSGKSSLIRAGVAAALAQDGRLVVIASPGEHPMQTLSALPEPRPGSVLVVDQCEEAFSLCGDGEERSRFLAALVARAGREPLLIAMRADRLSEVSAYPGFARLLERGLYLLGSMSERSLRETVLAPARQAGLLVEPGLVDLLVSEVAGTPGALPMLSHALLETWNRREDSTLTVAGYTASGGIRRAVAQSAEEVYAGVDPQQRRMLRDLLLRLVTAGPEGEPVRSRVPHRLLSADSQNTHLIDLLVASRLVTSDAGVVEIAHEALARAWPRLAAWLDDDVEGQRILHHLSGAADAWDSMGRPDSELYRGLRATRALEWQATQQVALTGTEVDFLRASARLEQAEQRAASERARAQTRLIRRLRGVLVAATVLLLAALIAGGLAAEQKGEAQASSAAARLAQTAAEARRAGARALATDDIDTSLLSAVAGVALDDSPETRSSLLAALGKHPELIASTQLAGARILDFDVSPDGRTVAAYDAANHLRVYDVVTGRLRGQLQAGAPTALYWETRHVRFSPDGRTLAVAPAAPTTQPVRLLDADTLDPVSEQPGGPAGRRWEVLDLAYSGDGQHLAATLWRVEGRAGTTRATTTWAIVWDLDAPGQPTVVPLPSGNPGVALSPDGRLLYTTTPFMIHDLASGVSTPVEDPPPVERLAVSPDGRLLASPGDGGLLLLDATTGKVRRRLPGNGRVGFYVTFSSDGTRVATITFETREALVWDLATGGLVARLALGEGGEVVDFGDGGATLFTAGDDVALRHWDIDGGRRFVAEVGFAPDATDLSAVQPSPGGRFIAYPNADHVTFVGVAAGTHDHVDPRGSGYRRGGGSWHPDGAHYAIATGGEVRTWDARTDRLTGHARPAGRFVSGLDYSTDGSRIVIGELSGRVTMLDARTLRPVGHAVRLGAAVCCLSAGPDNHTAVALTGTFEASGFWVGASTRWALVDLNSGTVVREGPLGIDGYAVAYSPDGRHVAVSGERGELLVLDLDTGRPVRPPVSGHVGVVVSLTYSATGGRLLTSGSDSSVGLWQGATGRLIARVVTPERFNEAGFGGTPHTVLIAPLVGGPVLEWDTRTRGARAFACRAVGRDLTRAEWREQFGDRRYRHLCSA